LVDTQLGTHWVPAGYQRKMMWEILKYKMPTGASIPFFEMPPKILHSISVHTSKYTKKNLEGFYTL
jgi:hypothetical protein